MVALRPIRESPPSAKEEHLHHHAGASGEGSYIDDLILRDRDTSPIGAGFEERVYYCQNFRHDVIAITDDLGQLLEQVRYSAYGVPFALPSGDTDSDGDWDSTDESTIVAIGSGYSIRADADLDGTVDSDDITHANSIADGGGYQTLGRTVLSSSGVENRFGYAGYRIDDAIGVFYHVRHRVLHTGLGRWTRRDPLGYVDGMNLYQYVASNPLRWWDPTGEFIDFGCLARCVFAPLMVPAMIPLLAIIPTICVPAISCCGVLPLPINRAVGLRRGVSAFR